MKKLLLSILSIAAIAACSKSEVEFEQPGEIGFRPVAQNITKSMLEETSFPTTGRFNVWAWYKQLVAGTTISAWQTNTTANQLYIPEKPFQFKSGTDWGGVTTYYWPKMGSLLFAGYYPTSIADKVDYTFDANNNKMVFTGIQQSQVDDSGYEEDIMYFNMTPSSYAANTVQVTFKHALSWISMNVKKSQGSPKIVIDEIKFTDVNPQGTGTVDNQSTISWTTTGTAASTSFGTNVELTEAGTDLIQPLFIPQGMAGNIVIKYTVYSSDTEKFTETYTAALSSLKTDLDEWEPAKHYIYTIEIGTTEILIAPTVADWTDVEVPVTVQ